MKHSISLWRGGRNQRIDVPEVFTEFKLFGYSFFCSQQPNWNTMGEPVTFVPKQGRRYRVTEAYTGMAAGLPPEPCGINVTCMYALLEMLSLGEKWVDNKLPKAAKR